MTMYPTTTGDISSLTTEQLTRMIEVLSQSVLANVTVDELLLDLQIELMNKR